MRYWNAHKDGFNKTDVIYFPDKLGKTKDGTIRYDQYENSAEFTKFISEFGFKPKDLIGLKGVRNRAILSMIYYKKIEDIITEIHLKSPLIL